MAYMDLEKAHDKDPWEVKRGGYLKKNRVLTVYLKIIQDILNS